MITGAGGNGSGSGGSGRGRWPTTVRFALWAGLGVVATVSTGALPERETLPEQYETVFEGRPAKRVVAGYAPPEGRWLVHEGGLSRADAEEYRVRVVRDRRGNHFWASREMKPMVVLESEAFVTYSAGEYGYVKTPRDRFLDMQRGVFDPDQEYMEHVIDMLYSITYWGTRTDR